jgi:hypothetical protein
VSITLIWLVLLSMLQAVSDAESINRPYTLLLLSIHTHAWVVFHCMPSMISIPFSHSLSVSPLKTRIQFLHFAAFRTISSHFRAHVAGANG